jgi:hypothetical protein
MRPTGWFKIRSRWNSQKFWGGHEWWSKENGWGEETQGGTFTLYEAETMTLPAGGEWVYEPPTHFEDDNNEEEVDVPHRRDGRDDNSVTD